MFFRSQNIFFASLCRIFVCAHVRDRMFFLHQICWQKMFSPTKPLLPLQVKWLVPKRLGRFNARICHIINHRHQIAHGCHFYFRIVFYSMRFSQSQACIWAQCTILKLHLRWLLRNDIFVEVARFSLWNLNSICIQWYSYKYLQM